jgi:hypothetical protein
MSNARKQHGGGQQDPVRHRAGALEIRNVVGALIGFYGIVLIIMGSSRTPRQSWPRPAA